MDGNKFKEWLLGWFSEVSKVSTGPWLLLLDNCGGHDARLSLHRVIKLRRRKSNTDTYYYKKLSTIYYYGGPGYTALKIHRPRDTMD